MKEGVAVREGVVAVVVRVLGERDLVRMTAVVLIEARIRIDVVNLVVMVQVHHKEGDAAVARRSR